MKDVGSYLIAGQIGILAIVSVAVGVVTLRHPCDPRRSRRARHRAGHPAKGESKKPIGYDREVYKRRNLIERCVNALKQFRRIATRYEKTARAFLSMLCIGAAKLWIKTVNTA